MRIGLIAPVNVAENKRFFSGVGHELYRVLNERADVIPLVVPLELPPLPHRIHLRLRRRWTGKRYNINLHPWTVRNQARQGMRLASAAGVDVALYLGQSGTAYWDSPIPAAFFSDTLYGAAFNMYVHWQLERMDPLQLKQLQKIGQKAVDNAVAVFVTNAYSFERARGFGTRIPVEKQVVTFIGPNLPVPDKMGPAPPFPPLRLLWVGSKWNRKGGADCLAVADALVAAGVPVELHMVGRKPKEVVRPFLTFYGYLRKGVNEEFRQLLDLYQTCHFLILPSQGDLGPVGLADAAAMGLPAVTTAVGGIPGFFPNGEVIMLPPDQFRTAAPLAIQRAIDSGKIWAMRQQVRQRFEEALNWAAVADKIMHKLENALTPA